MASGDSRFLEAQKEHQVHNTLDAAILMVLNAFDNLQETPRPPSAPSPKVRIYYDLKAGDLRVADNGPGLDPQAMVQRYATLGVSTEGERKRGQVSLGLKAASALGTLHFLSLYGEPAQTSTLRFHANNTYHVGDRTQNPGDADSIISSTESPTGLSVSLRAVAPSQRSSALEMQQLCEHYALRKQALIVRDIVLVLTTETGVERINLGLRAMQWSVQQRRHQLLFDADLHLSQQQPPCHLRLRRLDRPEPLARRKDFARNGILITAEEIGFELTIIHPELEAHRLMPVLSGELEVPWLPALLAHHHDGTKEEQDCCIFQQRRHQLLGSINRQHPAAKELFSLLHRLVLFVLESMREGDQLTAGPRTARLVGSQPGSWNLSPLLKIFPTMQLNPRRGWIYPGRDRAREQLQTIHGKIQATPPQPLLSEAKAVPPQPLITIEALRTPETARQASPVQQEIQEVWLHLVPSDRKSFWNIHKTCLRLYIPELPPLLTASQPNREVLALLAGQEIQDFIITQEISQHKGLHSRDVLQLLQGKEGRLTLQLHREIMALLSVSTP